MIGLGVLILIAVLSFPARTYLRKRLVPLPSPKLPPSGAAPWSRIQANGQANSTFMQQGNSMVQTPENMPFAAGFNAMPTTIQYNGAVQDGPPVFNTPPPVPAANSYAGPPQSIQPYPTTPPVAPVTPPLLPRIEAQYSLNAQEPVIAPVLPGHAYPQENNGQYSSNAGPGAWLRHNAPQTAGAQPPEQTPDMLSADMRVMSDPYVQSMLQRYSQKGQFMPPVPGESS